MIDPIDAMCRVWGAQKWHVLRRHELAVSITVPAEIMAISDLSERQKALEHYAVAQIRRYKTSPDGHEQGWSPRAVLSKFREMRDGAGSSTQRLVQFPEEGHVGEGLMVARAMATAPETLRNVLFVHYVIRRTKAPTKAEALGLSLAEYWRDLDRSHYWIAARVDLTFPVKQTVETKKPVGRINEYEFRE